MYKVLVLIIDLHEGLVIYYPVVGGGRIQIEMTKILNPPLRARKFFLIPLAW